MATRCTGSGGKKSHMARQETSKGMCSLSHKQQGIHKDHAEESSSNKWAGRRYVRGTIYRKVPDHVLHLDSRALGGSVNITVMLKRAGGKRMSSSMVCIRDASTEASLMAALQSLCLSLKRVRPNAREKTGDLGKMYSLGSRFNMVENKLEPLAPNRPSNVEFCKKLRLACLESSSFARTNSHQSTIIKCGWLRGVQG